MNVKQTTDTICSVTASPLRGGVAESVDMGSERMVKRTENGGKGNRDFPMEPVFPQVPFS